MDMEMPSFDELQLDLFAINKLNLPGEVASPTDSRPVRRTN